MEFFSVDCFLEHQKDRERSVCVPEVMADTGSELTWINRKQLEQIGVNPEKSVRFVKADGAEITRSIGFAIIRVGNQLTTDEVVFAEQCDAQLLGARTLDGLNMRVDTRNKKLINAGPIQS